MKPCNPTDTELLIKYLDLERELQLYQSQSERIEYSVIVEFINSDRTGQQEKKYKPLKAG